MRYSQIIEALSRRSFLKRTGATAAASTLPMSPIEAAKNLGLDPQAVGDLWNLIEIDVHGSAMYAGMLPEIKSSPDEITNVIQQIFQRGDTALKSNLLASYNTSETLNNYTNGAFAKEIREYISRIGPLKVAQNIITYNDSLSWGITRDDRTWVDLLGLSKVSPEFAKVFPERAFRNALEGFPVQAARMLHRRGVISQEQLNDIVTKWRRKASVRKPNAREKHGKDLYKQEKPEKAPVEKYDVPDDYKLASPMHQPFEERLNKVLGIIESNEDIERLLTVFVREICGVEALRISYIRPIREAVIFHQG